MLLRRKTPRRSASSHAKYAFPKGPTRAVRKALVSIAQGDHISTVRAAVFVRDPTCRCCLGTRKCWLPDQMHELVARSRTRGRPLEERFSLVQCIRLCAWCHADVTEHRVTITFGVDGGEGLLEFTMSGYAPSSYVPPVTKPVNPKTGKGGKTVTKVKQ